MSKYIKWNLLRIGKSVVNLLKKEMFSNLKRLISYDSKHHRDC